MDLQVATEDEPIAPVVSVWNFVQNIFVKPARLVVTPSLQLHEEQMHAPLIMLSKSARFGLRVCHFDMAYLVGQQVVDRLFDSNATRIVDCMNNSL